MRMKDRIKDLEERLALLEEPVGSIMTQDEYLWTGESRALRSEIKDLRNLLDEVIEPGYVLAKKGGTTVRDSFYLSFQPWSVLPARPPVTYEIRRRISNELIATFQNRHDADVFIESLDGETVDETGEEVSE